jgi:hypothetical protein
MAIELQHYKTCPRCNNTYPATTEYFHRAGKSGLSSYCKECKREHIRLWRAKQTDNRPRAVKSITSNQIEALKENHPEGGVIKIITDKQRARGRVIRHYEHFMTVQTTKYPTSVLYKDILIGEVRIKEG